MGTLTAIDPDLGDTHTFSLVAGAGDTDNGLFQVVGTQLQTSAVFNYETTNSYSIRIQTTDNGGLTRTHMPILGSPVIDAGDNAFVGGLTTDQRGTGFPRTLDGDGDTTLSVDLGAVEAPTLILPEASILASDAEAGEPADDGEFTVSIDIPADGAMNVNYSIGGTADGGNDYELLTGTVQIADGENKGIIPILVIDDDEGEADETVIVTLLPGDSYVVGAPASDTVIISSEELPETIYESSFESK